MDFTQQQTVYQQQHWYGCTSMFKTAKMFLTHSSSEFPSSSTETSSSGASLYHRNAGWGRGGASCAEEVETLNWSSMVAWQRGGELTAGNICVDTVQTDRGDKRKVRAWTGNSDCCPPLQFLGLLITYTKRNTDKQLKLHSWKKQNPELTLRIYCKWKMY